MSFPSCNNSTSSDFLLIAIEHDGLHGGSISALIDNISLPLQWKYFCIFIFQLSFIFSGESVYMMHIFWSKFCLPVCIKYQCTCICNNCCCLVAQSCPTLCDPMDCSMPHFPVLHHLPELAQTHVHRIRDTIQPSHPLSFPSPAFSISQDQSLF